MNTGSIELNEFHRITWEISDWLSHNNYKPGQRMISKMFILLDHAWYLVIYPNGEKSEGYVSVALLKSFLNETCIDVRYEFSLVTSDYRLIVNYDSVKKKTIGGSAMPFIVDKLARNSTVTECVRAASDNKLIVVCTISTRERHLREEASLRVGSDTTQHLRAFESFIGNERFSDVKFKVEGKEIFAHSPVFAAMFEHQMRENEENIVTIEDIGYEVFYELLRFVYLGKCNFDKDTVSGLLAAADKYQLMGLKSTCEKVLCSNLSIDNVFVYLTLADMHNAVDLKEKAIDFVTDHMAEMIRRPELESLKNLDIRLFREIIQHVIPQEQS